MALVNIMLLAGCGLDLIALKEHIGIITRLTLIPTIVEVGAITFLAQVLLDVPLIWGVVMGLVVTAISPNVVISVLLKLKEDGIGLYKGIHTIIIATTSCNDIIAIFLFGVLTGIIFSTGNLSTKIIQGPAGIILGLVFGSVSGIVCLFLPSDKAVSICIIGQICSSMITQEIISQCRNIQKCCDICCWCCVAHSALSGANMWITQRLAHFLVSAHRPAWL